MSAIPAPPEGLDLTDSRVSINNAVVGLVMGIATVFLVLRIWARASPVYRVGIDDWWTGAAMVGPFCPGRHRSYANFIKIFSYGTGICCILGACLVRYMCSLIQD